MSLYIELFGSLQVRCGTRTITRFRTQKTAGLLAYLASHKHRMHAREVLVEQFWPESESEATGRASLSVSLGSLRAQLEPRGVPGQSVFLADKNSIGLHPDVETDVALFERLLDAAQQTSNAPDKRAAFAEEAITLFQPDLLSGHYDDWISPKQIDLTERLQTALLWLVPYYKAQDKSHDALRCARQLIAINPELAQSPERLVEHLGQGRIFAGMVSTAVNVPSLRNAPAARVAGGKTAAIPRPDSPLLSGFEPGSVLITPFSLPQDSGGSGLPNVMDAVLPSPRTNGLNPKSRTSFDSTLTPFFGREEEIAHLLRRLQPAAEFQNDHPARLLTITGPGGIGKTRLALALADQFQMRWSETKLHFVSLSGMLDARLLPASIAQAVGISDEPTPASFLTDKEALSGMDLLAPRISSALREALAAQPCLLVLDGMESIAEESAPYLEALLQKVPSLTCLVTSQVRLGIYGEEEYQVPPLPVPSVSNRSYGAGKSTDSWMDAPPDSLLERWPSLALFVDRAQLAQTDFVLTSRNVSVVVPLVARLEGIPLAIELAAARMRVCTPTEMLAQITNQRFTFLVNKRQQRRYTTESETQKAWGRHASLHAALSWTVNLLSPEVRQFFARLSVFRGGWTAEAAEAVTDEPLALDYLAELSDASLIRSIDCDGEEMRFSVLETLREFAHTLLESPANQAFFLPDAHARYYLGLAEKAVPHVYGPKAPLHLAQLAAEHENFRAALRSVTDNPFLQTLGLRLGTALQPYWRVRGHFTEGRYWLDLMVEQADKTVESHTAEICPLIALALNRAGVLAMTQGDLEAAETRYARSLTLRKMLGDNEGIAATLNNCAILACKREQFDQAHAFYTESLQLWRDLGEKRHVGTVLANLGGIAKDSGDLTAAHAYYTESLEMAQTTGDALSIATRQRNLGEIWFEQQHYETAEALFQDSLRALLPLEDHRALAYSLLNLGLVNAIRGETRRATRFIDAALAAFQTLGVPLSAFTEKSLAMCYPDFINTFPVVSQESGNETEGDIALNRLITLVPLAVGLNLND